MAATHPVRHDGANPTQAGGRYALDKEIPLTLFVAQNSPNRFQRIRLRQNPALRSEINLPSANSVFYSHHSSFSRADARWWFLISVDNAGIHFISASRI